MSRILFKTKRCLIREFESMDIESLMAYRNNLDWMKYQGFKNKSKAEYKKAVLVPFNINNGSQLAFCNITDNTLYGDIYIQRTNLEINIGYSISPLYARQGFTYEVLSGLLVYLKRTYPQCYFVADLEKANHVSQKLLIKLGFILVKDVDNVLYYELRKS